MRVLADLFVTLTFEEDLDMTLEVDDDLFTILVFEADLYITNE